MQSQQNGPHFPSPLMAGHFLSLLHFSLFSLSLLLLLILSTSIQNDIYIFPPLNLFFKAPIHPLRVSFVKFSITQNSLRILWACQWCLQKSIQCPSSQFTQNIPRSKISIFKLSFRFNYNYKFPMICLGSLSLLKMNTPSYILRSHFQNTYFHKTFPSIL